MAWWFAEGRYQATDSFSFCPRIPRRAIFGVCSLKGFWLYKKKNHTDKRLTHFQTHFVLQTSVHFYQKGTLLPTKLQEVTHFRFYKNLFNCLWLLTFIQMAEQRNTTKLKGEFSNFSFRKALLKDICANFSISRRQKLFFSLSLLFMPRGTDPAELCKNTQTHNSYLFATLCPLCWA